jgi:hypothetical protein
LAGNRKRGIGVVEMMRLLMILAGLVSFVEGGDRASCRVGAP